MIYKDRENIEKIQSKAQEQLGKVQRHVENIYTIGTEKIETFRLRILKIQKKNCTDRIEKRWEIQQKDREQNREKQEHIVKRQKHREQVETN